MTSLSKRARLLLAGVRATTGDLQYHPSDQWHDEFLELKRFMRRAFQLLAYNGIDGDYAEFGSFGARTYTLAWGAARLVGHPARLWAFDSFAGLPAAADARDAHPGWTEGAMAMTEDAFIAACVANGIPRGDVHTIPGYYSESLAPGAVGERPVGLCFAYIDCDLYTSTVEVLRYLEPSLRHGMVLAFDDYYAFGPERPSGERLAVAEVLGAHPRWRLVPYIQWGWYGMSFVVEERGAVTADPVAW